MSTNILQKSSAFFETYERKAGDHTTTHYCPGCGHGILHKLIAEAIEDLGLSEHSVFVSPVGCSVFAYYYFRMGNIQSAHGRAPAVASGYKRANPDSIVISYQGDGDLAAIGGNEILHAANRGEPITVFFINNAIYGMTGGQMAPTTLIGQKSTTTPRGRNVGNEGYPLKVSELIATLEAPVYVERTMLTDAKNINITRKAVRKALQIQKEKKGFSFIEVLSNCPTGWKMSPPDSLEWVENTLSKYFIPGVKKDVYSQREPVITDRPNPPKSEYHQILDIQSLSDYNDTPATLPVQKITEELKIAGFGGQGVLSLGYVLANIAMGHNYEVSWLPSYGPEQRGGTANCGVKISHKRIGSPLVAKPTTLIAMNRPSLEKFEKDVIPGGNIIYDSSLIEIKPSRTDINIYPIPATALANDMSSSKSANMIMLGAYSQITGFLDKNYIDWALPKIIKKKEFDAVNREALQKGIDFIKEMNK